MIDTIMQVLKEFGFPVALCAVLLLAIRKQNKDLTDAYQKHIKQLTEAYCDRINTLETIVKDQGSKIDVLQNNMVDRTQEYANSLKDVAIRCANATHEVFATLREMLPVLRQMTRIMSKWHTDMPSLPPDPSTDRIPPQ